MQNKQGLLVNIEDIETHLQLLTTLFRFMKSY